MPAACRMPRYRMISAGVFVSKTIACIFCIQSPKASKTFRCLGSRLAGHLSSNERRCKGATACDAAAAAEPQLRIHGAAYACRMPHAWSPSDFRWSLRVKGDCMDFLHQVSQSVKDFPLPLDSR